MHGSTLPAGSRREAWTLATARGAAIVAAIGAASAPPLANVGAGVMLIAFIVLPSARRRVNRFAAQPLALAVLVLLILLALSVGWSIASPRESLDELWHWRNYLLLLIGLAIFDDPRWKLRLALAFVLGMAPMAMLATSEWATGKVLMGNHPPGMLLRNTATQSVAFAAAAYLALMIAPQFHRLKPALWAAAGVLAFNVAFAGISRSGHVALVVLAFAAVLGLLTARVRLIGLVAVLILAGAVAAVSSVVHDRFKLALDEVRTVQTDREATSAGVRWVFLSTTWAMIVRHPLLGYGVGGFAPAYAETTRAINTGWRAVETEDPHNQYLLVASTLGMVGLAVFAWMVIAAFRQHASPPFRAIGLGLLGAWCATSLFNSHFHTFNEGQMIAVFLGVFLALDDDRSREARDERRSDGLVG